MKIKYEKKALKFLAKADKSLVRNIREAVYGLTETPPKGDIKPMVGYKDGRNRLRYGKYRIIYRYDEESKEENTVVLVILNIGSRGDIYKEG